MWEHLVAKEFGLPQEMAKYADKLWEARNRSLGTMSAVGRHSTLLNRPQCPYGGKKRSGRNGLCFFHIKFGEKAHRCEPPCNWEGNNLAASNN